MTDPRTFANRFQLGIVIVVVTMLALTSFWVLDIMRRASDDDGPAGKRTEPDYYVEHFNFVRVSKDGRIRYHVSGERLLHHPQEDTYEIAQPVLKSLNEKLPPTTITAKRGLADLNISQIELFDDVQMHRPASPNAERLRMTSEHMLVLPDEDLIKTSKPVEIMSGNAVLTGVGMVANQATRQLQLFGNVHGMLPPPGSR